MEEHSAPDGGIMSERRDSGSDVEAARTDERRVLARTLHDEVGQLLTGVRLELAAAVERLKGAAVPDSGVIVDRLQAAVGLVDLSARAVRELAGTLRPPVVAQEGLVAAVRWEASVFAHRAGLRCEVSADPVNPSPGQETVLLRILLEALTNVARHAGASAVSIRLRQSRARLILQVRDNGEGLPAMVGQAPTSLGLLTMRERAAALDGQVYVTRMRTGGTRLVVSLPLEPVLQTQGNHA